LGYFPACPPSLVPTSDVGVLGLLALVLLGFSVFFQSFFLLFVVIEKKHKNQVSVLKKKFLY